ncbi:MAG TPA: hypothetical protein VHV08_17380, partial [Pirellulales bacterium]|nr:hypothetical protein [Pirellulales bacterium]
MTTRTLIVSMCAAWLASATTCQAADLSRAVVVTPENFSGPQSKAVEMLVDEVHKRTGIRWPVTHAWPSGDAPVVAVAS